MFQKIRKKPIAVEGFHVEDLDDFTSIRRELPDTVLPSSDGRPNGFLVLTSGGVLLGVLGDWIIKQASGELEVVKNTEFYKIYEIVTEGNT